MPKTTYSLGDKIQEFSHLSSVNVSLPPNQGKRFEAIKYFTKSLNMGEAGNPHASLSDFITVVLGFEGPQLHDKARRAVDFRFSWQ